MMRFPTERHLIYEIYPDILADWLSHQSIEDQALFISNYLSGFDDNKMIALSKEFASYTFAGSAIASDLEEFAKRAREILEGENND